MSKLTIKDLAESVDLDRDAMTTIIGGARMRGQINPEQASAHATRVVPYPDTLPRQHSMPGTKHARSIR